ncbi:MAG TPA: TlpA disulfide reductase family protein [Blastocatellia bacterium]|nr:TlpA disulfide reductase family protein [Blastocatellia bacterium]
MKLIRNPESFTPKSWLRPTALFIALFGLIAFPSCNRQPADINGRWQGVIFLSENEGDELPFRIELKKEDDQVTGSLVNGDERITSTGGSWDGRNLKLRFDFYDGELTAGLVRREMIGEFKRQWGKQTLTRRLKFWRETPNMNPPDQSGKNVSGEWLMRVGEGADEKVWRASFRQTGSDVTGTIIPVSGDWGVMTGSFYDGKLMLSRFDGINARTFKAVLNDAGALEGAVDFGLPTNRTRKVVAEKVGEANSNSTSAPPDPNSVTKVKNPAEPFRFSFPDLEGRVVSSTDERFKNKVVIATITGSWCPNCHDEAVVLNDLYDRYHSQGLEIVAFGFEYTGDAARDREQLKTFVKRHGTKYPVLLAGSTAEGEVEQKLPQLTGFGAYPTTIYIGRDGRVRKIHTGFEGPATGERFTRLKSEMDETVKELLTESDK